MPKRALQRNDLVEKIRAELIKNKGSWLRLSRLERERMGESFRFSYPWLHAFANSEMASPGIVPVIALSEYLGMEVTVKPGKHFRKFEP